MMGFRDNKDKESMSSQRTLRYNDFELIGKQAENDPNYALPLDDGQSEEKDQKDTERAVTDFRKSTQQDDINHSRTSLQNPDIGNI